MPVTLTRDALARLFPRARPEIREAIHASQAGPLTKYGITNTTRRLAYFLAQAAEESGGFTAFAENLSYSAKRMTEVWPARFPTLASARPYERNPEKLANKVYGGRMGNGPEASGDGWRFRGRGPIQLTGRTNYKLVGDFVGLDLLEHPELAIDPEHMMLVQCGYWAKNDLNRFADAGDFRGLTKAINGGLTNLAERQRWLGLVMAELGAPGQIAAPQPTTPRAPENPTRNQPEIKISGDGGFWAALANLLRRLFGART